MTQRTRILARAKRAQKPSHKMKLFILAGEKIRDTGEVKRDE